MTTQLLRLLAILLLLVLVQAGALAAAVLAHVPPWWSLLILPAALLAWGGFRLLRATASWLRSRRRRPASQVPPDAALARAWQRALAQGGAAHDGARLPWILLLGPPGAGKTTALSQARISSPVAPIQDRDDAEASFGLWYLNRLVVLDCGDCVPRRDAPAAEGARWAYHLRMLQRLRRREGLDGVVIALSARELLRGDREALAEQARCLRGCLEQLIQLLRERFPVYVLVTHCDALYGLQAWAQALPPQRLEQPLGYLEQGDAPQAQHDFVNRAFDAVGVRLDRLRWELLTEGHAPDAGLLAFPLELQRLRAPLQVFADNGLAPHPYLERLMLRGLFFSSGKQQAPADSQVLGDAASTAATQQAAARGLFLHELFARVLPAERGLRRASAAQLRRQRRARGVLLTLVLGLALLGAAALSASFADNLRALKGLRAAAPLPPAETAAPLARRAAQLLEREQAIRRFEAAGERPLAQLTLPATGWHELLSAQKLQFVQACQGLPEADSAALPMEPQRGPGTTVLGLLRRMAVLQARSEGAGLAQLELLAPARAPEGRAGELANTLWQIELARLAWSPAQGVERPLRSVRARLDQFGLSDPALQWLRQTPALDGIAAIHLAPLLLPGELPGELPGTGSILELPAEFTAAGFAHMREVLATWRRLSASPSQVDGAWQGFVTDWRERQQLALRALLEGLVSKPPAWRSRAAWRAALPLLAGPGNPYWAVSRQLLLQIPDTAEAAPAQVPEGSEPRWITGLRDLESWRAQAAAANPGAVLQSLRDWSERGLRDAAARGAGGAATAVRANLQAAADMREYLKALELLARQLQLGDAQATAVAADFQTYGTDPRTDKSLARDAQRALQRMDRLLEDAGAAPEAEPGAQGREAPAPATGAAPTTSSTAASSTAASSTADRQAAPASYPAGALLAAPWRELMRYADAAAACTLQRRWQAEVLWPLQTAATRADALGQVFGPQGTLWAFVQGPAAPFLQRDQRLYRPTRTAGLGVAFTPQFLDLLNHAAGQLASQQLRSETEQRLALEQGARQKRTQAELQQAQAQVEQAARQAQSAQAARSTVSITALPTDVEPPGTATVSQTRLSLRCGAGNFELNNLNLTVQGSVTWSAQDCADLRLAVSIAGIHLQRNYPGALGFADFLADFRSGTRAFTPQDFPAQSARLRALGVQRIVLHYRIEGADGVLGSADALRSAKRAGDQASRALQSLGQRQQQLLQAAVAASAPQAAGSGPAGPLPQLPARITDCADDPRPAQAPT